MGRQARRPENRVVGSKGTDRGWVVHLKLSRPVGDRLRRICEKEGKTASVLLGEWIESAVVEGADAEEAVEGNFVEGLKRVGRAAVSLFQAAKDSGTLERGAGLLSVLMTDMRTMQEELAGAPVEEHERIKLRFLGLFMRRMKEAAPPSA
jgi:hypothetical protein